MSDKRKKKIISLLIQEIAVVINREIKDPRMEGIISVLDLELSHDMKNADVFISVFDIQNIEQERKKTLEALNSAAGYIVHLLSKKLHMRYVPNLRFKLDTTMEKAAKPGQLEHPPPETNHE